VLVYVAGPLFTEAERAFLEDLARRLEAEGIDCFVPHRQTIDPLTPERVFELDAAGVRAANAMVAWLDGPSVDDGTACEIGIFTELVRADPSRYIGIVGLCTDWRLQRQRDAGMASQGVNHFVAGAIASCGFMVWDVDAAVAQLAAWAGDPGGGAGW
jgi:nucleoside 2-deoxyribosyltransferase